MRSIATPNDHIDMKKSTKATPFATKPIDCHICIKSTVHPPSSTEVRNLPAGSFGRGYCKVKFTVTVMITGTGTPFSRVGVNCHCRTASSAAASSSGIERSTFASCTAPFGPIVASMMTTPCTRADWAIAGYTGFTSFTLVGCLMLPPTRTGAGGGGGGGGGGGERGGRWRSAQAAAHAAGDATDHTTFDAADRALALFDAGLGLDFFRR